MRLRPTAIAGVVVIEPELVEDDRGFFSRLFSVDELEAAGLASSFAQVSVSYNREQATLRGLHIQVGEHAEEKLVRCTSGAIFDVAVDLRLDSPTHLKWVGLELTATNRLALYIPKGCAHGFVTLAPAAEVLYHISVAYHPAAARGLRFDDPAIGIVWPAVGPLTMSDRDRSWPGLSQGMLVDG